MWLEQEPQNFILTVLDGIDGSDGLPGAMPGFRDKLDDRAIEALATYLRGARTNAPGWPGVADLAPKVRLESMSQPRD